ncbi:MAG: hypothetical protein JEY94_07505 [Melioribacteraceae bacterium]|nr:hypothetical protein [Melioribacteraceae bacterium]
MENKFKLISVIIKPDDLNKLKIVLRNLRNENKDLVVSSPKMGKIGKDLLISFKINNLFQTKIVKTLTENSLTILSLKDRNEILKQIKEEKKPEAENADQESEVVNKGWGDLVKAVSDKPHTPINSLINEGNYSEILKIARDFRINNKFRKEAVNGVGAALNILIARVFRNGSLSTEPLEQIETLLKIGGDQSLKLIHEEDLMKAACTKAIELATLSEDSFKHLITICNNRNIHSFSTIEAVVKLSEIIFSDADKYFYLVELSGTDLNLRWLNIAFDSRPKRMEKQKIASFKKLVDFIQERRNNQGFEI